MNVMQLVLLVQQAREPRSSDGTCRYYNGNIRKALGGAMGGYTAKKKEIETAFKTVFIFEFAGCNRSLYKSI
jgi:hypothetical protein